MSDGIYQCNCGKQFESEFKRDLCMFSRHVPSYEDLQAEITTLRQQVAELETEIDVHLEDKCRFRDKLTQAQGRLSAYREALEDYLWLVNFKCNSFTLGRDDDHACNYVTAKVWIEEYSANDFTDTEPGELQKMKDTNTIWSLQIYPDTPVGFHVFYGATAESVIKTARQALTGDAKKEGK
jgi:hypothetical protein